MRNTHDGHFVLLEDQKILKTKRIVPYGLLEQEAEEQELTELGWTWLTNPEGRTFYQNKSTGEKAWETPMRLQEAEEQEPPQEEKVRKRMNEKQPPPAYLKEMKLKRFEIEEAETEVTRTISLHKFTDILKNGKSR